VRAVGPLLIVSCVAAAALSLLAPWALAFDPYAWLVWGREIAHGTLDTSAGPSWKPLPVLVTTPLSILGGGAPAAWLVVARTGALLAVAGAAVLGARLGGRAAGAAAALVLALSPWWWFNAALGNSEGLLAASVLWAAVAHLAGHRRAALTALTAGALIRPEIWPFLGLYGLGLWRAPAGPRALVAAAWAAVGLLWVLPGRLGGGGASDAAQGTPSAGSAALADVPFLAVLVDAAELVTVPAAAALLLLAARRERERDRPRGRAPELGLLAAAALYVLIVAVMTQAGYAGNPRYLVPAAALAAVLAAVATARVAAPLGLVLVALVAGVTAGDLRAQTRLIGARAETREGLGALAPAARAAARGCPAVRTSVPQRSAVAWTLRRPLSGGLDAPPRPPALVLRAVPYAGGPPQPRTAPPSRPLARAPRWRLETSCRP
jgi:hypothetical protein